MQFVMRNSPASAAGLRLGDQVLQVDGKDVLGMSGEKVTANQVQYVTSPSLIPQT